MTTLDTITKLPECCGTTWTLTTHYVDGVPIYRHIWADNIIVTRMEDVGMPTPEDFEPFKIYM